MGDVPENPGRAVGGLRAWRGREAGFTLVEVLVVTAVVGILGAALTGAAVNFSAFSSAMTRRAEREIQALAALARVAFGSGTAPGVAGAEAIGVPAPGAEADRLEFTAGGQVYQYFRTTQGQLAESQGSGPARVLVEGVSSLRVRRLSRDGRTVVRLELTVALPLPSGSRDWNVAIEVVARNL